MCCACVRVLLKGLGGTLCMISCRTLSSLACTLLYLVRSLSALFSLEKHSLPLQPPLHQLMTTKKPLQRLGIQRPWLRPPKISTWLEPLSMTTSVEPPMRLGSTCQLLRPRLVHCASTSAMQPGGRNRAAAGRIAALSPGHGATPPGSLT